jgi:GNAT superfamily N-acetyltransferase
MNRTWTTTWLERADLGKIEEFRRLFSGGETYSDVTMSEFYEWKYFRGSEGPAYVRVAVDKGKLVGTAAATLKRIKIGGRTLLAAEIGDAFTHPEYQYQGIFTVLGRELVTALDQKGVHFIYARPNANSFPGFVRKMGFDDVFHLRTMRRFVNIDNVLRRKTGGGLLYSLSKPAIGILSNTVLRVDEAPALPGIDISEASSFDESVDRLFDEVSGDDTAMVVRDSRYLNWRYAEKPVEYKIYTARDGSTLVGYVIDRTIQFEAGHKYGYLVDIMARSAAVMRLLLGRTMRYFAGEGVDLVSTWVMKDLRRTDNTYYQALQRARFGFARDEYYFVTRTDLPEVKKLIYETEAARWRFRLGETDGI